MLEVKRTRLLLLVCSLLLSLSSFSVLDSRFAAAGGARERGKGCRWLNVFCFISIFLFVPELITSYHSAVYDCVSKSQLKKTHLKSSKKKTIKQKIG